MFIVLQTCKRPSDAALLKQLVFVGIFFLCSRHETGADLRWLCADVESLLEGLVTSPKLNQFRKKEKAFNAGDP